MDECTKLNQQWGKPVDYMVSCNIHTDCGGGTVWMSKSQCDKPCSGLPNKSDNTQTNNVPASNTTTNTQNTSNKVQFNATETSIPGTYYCYENKVNEMVTQQSLTKGARELYETCKDSTYNEQVFKDCWNSNCEGLPDTNDCADSCYSQAFGECKGYYEDYLGYRSKLDKMRWDNCP